MYRMRVTYGHPVDSMAFDEHYRTIHLPLVERIPGILEFYAGRCEEIDGGRPDDYFVAEIVFHSRDDAEAGLASSEGQAAAADAANFATGGVSISFCNDDLVTS